MNKDSTNPETTKVSAFPIEEVAKFPRPGTAIPGVLAFSPDDGLITYLFSPDANLIRQLYAYNPETGEQSLVLEPPDGGTTEKGISLEEALRRERQRQLELGVTQYVWADQANRLLIPLRGDIYVQDGLNAPLRKIVESEGKPALDAQFSPNGDWVAYVQDAELYVVAASGGEPRQITQGARGTGKTHGLAEYVAQEEMGRRHGFWWSPDSQWIAFTEVDETHIPVYRIVHQGKDVVGEGAQEDHRYPFVGKANARVRLGVVSVEGGEPIWMDLGGDKDIYLARVEWLPDGDLSAQLENREQTELELLRFDPRTGRQDLLLRETNGVWINLHDMFKPLKHSPEGGFIWASERSGYRHLYLYDKQGDMIRSLTEGEWIVDDVVGVDEEREQVYFTATRAGPTERHLYAVSFAGGEPRQITREPGMHAIVADHAFRRFIDVRQSLDKPPSVTLRSLADGSVLQTIYTCSDPRVDELKLQPPELVTLQNRAGVTLHGAIYRPPASFGEGPYPTIVSVYGGPHAQFVFNSWDRMTVDMRAQYLCSLGFLVFKLDNRGSARRGLGFESAIKHNMGCVEVKDQVDGVNWLIAQGLADPNRVGIYGWSYGGYMAAMCLAQAPDTFQVAVAGAPVTHHDGYDTYYTERYMGTPQSNPQGYAEGSVMHHVEKIRGKLLLIHGLIDENVHFRHTARLINALINARKPYDLLLFPDERHTPRKPADRIYMEERIRDYFVQHLCENDRI
jgi:dipeptidyl-peptidase-4